MNNCIMQPDCIIDMSDLIKIKIPTARQKLQVNFPEDSKGDLRLVFKSKSFNLQKAYLRLQSAYFKRMCTPTRNLLQIKENFDEQSFAKVMNCFYGATISVDRLQLPKFYPIIRFLQIQSVLNFVKDDILKYIGNYEIFEVMRMAHQYSDQQLFEVCLEELEKQSFEHLKYHKFQFLQTQQALFKLIIKTHNRFRANTGLGLSYIEIDQFLKDYCEALVHGQQKYHQLKFELIDKTVLTSEEYKKIFIDQITKYKNNSPILQRNNTVQSNAGLNKFVTNNLAESIFTPAHVPHHVSSTQNITIHNQITQEMQNTYEKKRNEELRDQNTHLENQLQNLKSLITRNKDIHDQMQNDLRILKEELKKKEQQEQEHKKMINKFDKIIAKLEKQLQDKSIIIEKLSTQFQELKNRKPTAISDDGSQDIENVMVHSQFLPAHLIGEMMIEAQKGSNEEKPKKKNQSIDETTQKIQESLDEQELEALYLPRLNFDYEPVSSPKLFLPRIANFLSAQGFNKKNLTLIYRRSRQFDPVGVNMDICQKQTLLIILNTISDQVVGGYVSVNIPRNGADYLEDKEAFIFSLSKNQKFHVKKNEEAEAIFLSETYLISFGNDLMIASDCLNDESYCSWPTCYEGMKSSKQRGSTWLVGGEDSHFKIKHIDIYEVHEADMEMMIID